MSSSSDGGLADSQSPLASAHQCSFPEKLGGSGVAAPRVESSRLARPTAGSTSVTLGLLSVCRVQSWLGRSRQARGGD